MGKAIQESSHNGVTFRAALKMSTLLATGIRISIYCENTLSHDILSSKKIMATNRHNAPNSNIRQLFEVDNLVCTVRLGWRETSLVQGLDDNRYNCKKEDSKKEGKSKQGSRYSDYIFFSTLGKISSPSGFKWSWSLPEGWYPSWSTKQERPHWAGRAICATSTQQIKWLEECLSSWSEEGRNAKNPGYE